MAPRATTASVSRRQVVCKKPSLQLNLRSREATTRSWPPQTSFTHITTMSQKMNWYLCISGEALGPLSKESVALLLKDRRIWAGDYVWRYGLNEWKPLMD